MSEPEGEPRAALVLLQGGGPPCRAGVNASWAHLARELADRGIIVLRVDFVAEGESTIAGAEVERGVGWRRNSDLAILHELSPWFRERAGLEDLLLAGSCHGARVAMDFAADDPKVAGTFLIVPYLWNLPPNMRPDKQASRHKGLPRAREVYDRGSSNVGVERALNGDVEAFTDKGPLDESIVERCRMALHHNPVWILIGEGDSQKPVEMKERLGADGKDLTVEVVPELIIHPVTHPETQAAATAWLKERLWESLHHA